MQIGIFIRCGMARVKRVKQRAMILVLTLIVIALITTLTLMMLEKTLVSTKLLSIVAAKK